jgi:catechol 2,3-dioxygenase-like lactoylglutathione lyase family enzyme
MTSDRPSIESISAVTLAVADMARSVGFYEGIGFRRRYGGPDADFTSFQVGRGFLNLQLDREHAPVPRIWGRVIFHVSDVDQLHARLKAQGVVPSSVPADAPWGERYFHVTDPDGHELSFARLLV